MKMRMRMRMRMKIKKKIKDEERRRRNRMTFKYHGVESLLLVTRKIDRPRATSSMG